MLNKLLLALVFTIIMSLPLSYVVPAFALDIELTAISTPFNTPIGIDHFEPTNEVVMSVNYASGNPHNFELVAADGTRTVFSTISGFTNEIKIATARDDGVNSFAPGTLFTGNGADGQIAMINPDATFLSPWVTLPDVIGCPAPHGLMRGSLYVDRTGVYNGDLIIVTTGGEVWRIDSSGTPTCIDSVGVHLEGVATVPNDPQFGTLAGKIIAGAEQQSRVWAFDDTGDVGNWFIPFNIEDIDLIPENENFFGVNFGTSRLLGAPASAFDTVEGQILITDESVSGSGLALLKWDSVGGVPIVETIGLAAGSFTPGQWEHVTFSSAGILEIPPICPPGTVGTFPECIPITTSVVGGELLPIETTSLLVAGAQSTTLMIPVVLSVIGIGLVLVRRFGSNLSRKG